MEKKYIKIATYEESSCQLADVYLDMGRIGSRNYGMLLLGAPGGGKSTVMQSVQMELAKAGHLVIVLDLHNTSDPEHIFSGHAAEFERLAHRFDAYRQPIPCHLMEPVKYQDGSEEFIYDTADFQTEALSAKFHFGVRQKPTCLKAIRKVIHDGSFVENGYQAVGNCLTAMNSEVAANVYDKLEVLFEHNIFTDGELPFEKGRINIIDLSKYSDAAKELIAELLLHYLFRQRIVDKIDPFFVNIDEFQNIGLDKHGILGKMLSEGRRFGINTILATQSPGVHFSNAQQKLLMQSNYKFFFKPSEADAKEFAKYIDPARAVDVTLAFRSMVPGQFFLCGPKIIKGIEDTTPLILNAAV